MALNITDHKVHKNPLWRGLLAYLWEAGGESPKELSMHYGYSENYLLRILNAMYQADYLVKSKKDGKFVSYNISEKGKTLLKAKGYIVVPKKDFKNILSIGGIEWNQKI